MKSLLAILAFVSVGASASTVKLSKNYVESCKATITVVDASTSSPYLYVEGSGCKTVIIEDAFSNVISSTPLLGDYPAYYGVIYLTPTMQNYLKTDGKLYVVVTSQSAKHIDALIVTLENAPLPKKWSYNYEYNYDSGTYTCYLYDSTGNKVQKMINERCDLNSQTVPNGFEYDHALSSTDTNCYLWNTNNEQVSPNPVSPALCKAGF